MRTVKIYALPSHQTKERNSGVDYVRLVSPMEHLNGYKLGDVTFQVDIFDINKKEKESWIDVGDNYDLVFFNYTVVDWHYAAMASIIHGKGKKLVMDLDDAIWFVQTDNIVHKQLQELNGAYIITCICDDVDGVITTNSYLKNVIADKSYKKHDDILVVPNQIDMKLYNQTHPAKEENTITLMHFGSTSHFDDLLDVEYVKGVDRIMQEYPNVVFKAVGSFIQEFRMKWGQRYINAFGDVDIYRWAREKFPEFMKEADIMVVPLRDTKYNRCKSDIKFIETASAMKPGVFSDTRPYLETIENGKTGFIASSADEWYESIKKLIDSKELRQEIGKNAYEYVKSERQIEKHVEKYARYFLSILDKK